MNWFKIWFLHIVGPQWVEQVQGGLHKFCGWVRAEHLQLESRCAHEVHSTSKRIIQAFPLFDYGRSPDFPLPATTMHFTNQLVHLATIDMLSEYCAQCRMLNSCISIPKLFTKAYKYLIPVPCSCVLDLFFIPTSIKTQMFYINILGHQLFSSPLSLALYILSSFTI